MTWSPGGGPGGPQGPSGPYGPPGGDSGGGPLGPGPFGPGGAAGPGGPWTPRGGAPERRGPRRPQRAGDWLRAHGAFALVLVAVLGLLAWGLIHRHVLDSFELLILAAYVPAVVLHEVSHGVVALWCGDDTAKQAGRLTLNPIRHVDPLGSVILPVILLLSPAHRVFGWAKPVPVRIDRLRHPRNQAVLVGIAGPLTNILLSAAGGALFFLLYGRLTVGVPASGIRDVYTSFPIGAQILIAFGFINIFLAGFNLLPVPPLDGSALLERLIPQRWLPSYYRVRTGFLVAVLLLVLVFNRPLADLFGWLETLWLNIFAGGVSVFFV